MPDIDLQAIRDRANAATPGPWHWGGNTDYHGDVGIYGHMPGLGVVDILRTTPETNTAETAGKEWDNDSELSDYIGREDYIEDRVDHPPHYLAVGRPDGQFVEPARDYAVYQVVRNQGLPDDTPRTHPKVYRADVADVNMPNAQFLAHAREDVGALLAEVERLQQAIRDLAEDGGNKAAEYWLRAHQAEQERDQTEQEADRLRGLLAEACDEHHDDILTRYATLEDDHGITPDSAEGHAYFTGYQDGLSAGERQKADAWDEGYTAGFYDRELFPDCTDSHDACEGRVDNPYRENDS